jgi:hypothetical protein
MLRLRTPLWMEFLGPLVEIFLASLCWIPKGDEELLEEMRG